MRTVLLLSRYFPPMYDVGGKRAYRFARYLPAHGWRAVVVTDGVPRERPVDQSLPPLDGVEVVRTYYPRWWSETRQEEADPTVPEATRMTDRTPRDGLEWLRWQVCWPVAADVWLAPRWAALARALVRAHRADAIFATSGPYTALVYGVVAAAATGLPLCLDLRDPWSFNPGQVEKPAWARWVDARAEAWLVGRSARVTVTSEATAQSYRARYPDLGASRFVCVYNSFDPAMSPTPAEPRADGPLRLVHFGNCYEGRRLDTILRALALLRDTGRLASAAVRVTNLGRVAQEDLDLATRLGVAESIEWRTAVPYAEGMELLAAADLQLLLAHGDETLFVPGKTFDYLLAGSPILCVAQASELTRIVADTRAGSSVAPGDIERAAAVIERAARARRFGESLPRPDHNALMRYSAPRTAEQLASVLDACVATAVRG